MNHDSFASKHGSKIQAVNYKQLRPNLCMTFDVGGTQNSNNHWYLYIQVHDETYWASFWGYLHMRKQRRRSASRFATRLVQSLYFLIPKFQASSHLLWLYSLVCDRPGWKPRRPVFSQRGSIHSLSRGLLHATGNHMLWEECIYN